MMPFKPFFLYLVTILILGCSTDGRDEEVGEVVNPEETGAYFPPNDSEVWETTDLATLEWKPSAEQPLYDYLQSNGTDAFIILKNGKIVLEKYFGDFTTSSKHAWFSVGKSLTAVVLGIAQQEGNLSLNDSSQEYLGEGWSSMNPVQEKNITVRNHITMTAGLDYNIANLNCTDSECFQFLNEPDSFWYYHTAAYTLTQDIIAKAVDKEFKSYFEEKLGNKIGMDGAWFSFSQNNIYRSTPRSMARFGLLVLNEGIWDGSKISTDYRYFKDMTNTSQTMNEAYGYLWWLNGKNSYKLPGSEEVFNGKLIPNAPNDLTAGLGAHDQKLYIVPSQNLVIVRMGDTAGAETLGLSNFDNQLWEKINALID